jgi:ABC-type transporter Mla MlaB component
MPVHAIHEQQKTRLIFDGALTIYEARNTRRELIEVLAGAQPIEVDLAGISEIDLSGVQLLLALLTEPNIAFQGSASAAVSHALRRLDIEPLFWPRRSAPEA